MGSESGKSLAKVMLSTNFSLAKGIRSKTGAATSIERYQIGANISYINLLRVEQNEIKKFSFRKIHFELSSAK